MNFESFENIEKAQQNEQLKLYCGSCDQVFTYEEASSMKCSRCSDSKLVFWNNNESKSDVRKKWEIANNK